MSKIKLGDYVRDTITGYEGIVAGITNWLNGCARIGIQNKEARNTETGLPVDMYWVDDATVEVIEEQVNPTKQNKTGASSFNTRNGMRNSDPTFH